jgi:RNA polymerase-binding transcription factor DksA
VPTPEDALTERRRSLTAQVAALERSFAALVEATEGANTDDEHDPEGSTIAFERSQLSASLAAARAGLADVEHALARVSEGTYGRCETCGRPIPAGRLEALPAATTCVGCAERLRRGAGGT